jgi:hypothetical protein
MGVAAPRPMDLLYSELFSFSAHSARSSSFLMGPKMHFFVTNQKMSQVHFVLDQWTKTKTKTKTTTKTKTQTKDKTQKTKTKTKTTTNDKDHAHDKDNDNDKDKDKVHLCKSVFFENNQPGFGNVP